MGIKKILNNYIPLLVGDEQSFSLEARIFHAVSMLSVLCLIVGLILNIFIELEGLSFLILGISLIFLFSFYLSRIKRQLEVGRAFFLIFSFLALCINYVYNSGINGPTILVFIVLFSVSLAISPPSQYKIWLSMNIIVYFSLLAFEYLFPKLIISSYPFKSGRFIDTGVSYFLCCCLMLLITHYVIKEFRRIHAFTLKDTKALEESNQIKNKLLSVIAHDLKEPLASIQTFLELLDDFELDAEERKSIEQGLLKKTQDTSFLLANMLSWTRNQMDAINIQLEALPLEETLQETIRSLQAVALEKKIKLESLIMKDLTVLGDRNMLLVVIRNLIMNAIKFTPIDGYISVNAADNNGICTLFIKDNGIGIVAEKQASLFLLGITPTPGTGKEKGAGLGLVLCKDFMQYQGGSIGFTSDLGMGSTFFITLPTVLNTEKASRPITEQVL